MEENLKINHQDWSRFVEFAKGSGFRDMAAAPAGKVKHEQTLRDWVANGFHAEMHWFARGLEKRLNPELVVEGARSIIVLTTPYYPEHVTLAGKKLARYACGDDYHDVLIKPLRALCDYMNQTFPHAQFRAYVDTGPVLERYWAEQAGLGWIGRSGNLISRTAGSYLFLASIVTDLEAPYGQPHAPFCGSCTACIDACPTDAIIADGVVDSNRCISYLSIEHRGPFEDAPPFEDWVFGCDICQEVCPWPQKFSDEPKFDEFLPRERYAKLKPEELQEMVQEDFSAMFRKSPIKRTKMHGVKRNMAHLSEMD